MPNVEVNLGEVVGHSNYGLLMSCGLVIPETGATGYAHGGIFTQLNGSGAAETVYINTGDSESATFEAIPLLSAVRNQPNGVAGLDANGNLEVSQIVVATDTAEEIDLLDLAEGSVMMASDTKHLVLGFETLGTPVQGGMPVFSRQLLPTKYVNDRLYDGGGTPVSSLPINSGLLVTSPIVIGERWSPNQIGINVWTRSGDHNARMGIYKAASSESYLPHNATLVAQTGEVLCNADDTVFYGSITANLDPGLYYLAVEFAGTVYPKYLHSS
jgi:hypothetical protein